MSQNVFEFPNAKSIVVSGDIHGYFTQLVYKCCIQYAMTDTLIIVAGDCGFGFEKPGYYENIYKRCRERLSKANNWIAFVRGNHDNPAYFRSALPLGSFCELTSHQGLHTWAIRDEDLLVLNNYKSEVR